MLNLAHPGAYAYILERMTEVLRAYPIAYVKWDHNRDLVDAATGPGGGSAVHAHTLAVYRLIDELKATFPGLEIESCASGGARVDLGILDRTDRIWTSDCLDPVERLETQRYTALVVPPEMMGMHLTTPHVHSTDARSRSRSAAPSRCSGTSASSGTSPRSTSATAPSWGSGWLSRGACARWWRRGVS